MNEIWKDVVGYEGLYKVSNMGNVLSNRNNIVLKPLVRQKNKMYQSVNLYDKNHKSRTYFIHQLVAIAFIPNPCKYNMVNHKDENPRNNNVENLEWCNAYYNNTYGNRINKMLAKTKGKKRNINKSYFTKIHSKTLLQYSLNNELLKEWLNADKAAKEIVNSNNTRSNSVRNIAKRIRMCCRGETSTQYGFIWKYKGA